MISWLATAGLTLIIAEVVVRAITPVEIDLPWSDPKTIIPEFSIINGLGRWLGIGGEWRFTVQTRAVVISALIVAAFTLIKRLR